MKTSAAYAPGHVSGLFAVHDEHPDVLRKGSRGTGWAIDRGATARVTPGSGKLTLSGARVDLAVTRLALAELDAGTSRLDVDVRLDMPVGQGFGMSASGSLAACLAAADLLDLEPDLALAATHRAEVQSGTGLGDAIGSWTGGAEVRIAPGIPPHGGALHVDAEAEFLFCVLGTGIATPAIIRDATWAAKTRQLGDPAVDRIVAAGRGQAWQTLLDEARSFSVALGLMPEAMRALARTLPKQAVWGQAMLGSALWVTGPAAVLAHCEPLLLRAGSLVKARIDPRGARLVRSA